MGEIFTGCGVGGSISPRFPTWHETDGEGAADRLTGGGGGGCWRTGGVGGGRMTGRGEGKARGGSNWRIIRSGRNRTAA